MKIKIEKVGILLLAVLFLSSAASATTVTVHDGDRVDVNRAGSNSVVVTDATAITPATNVVLTNSGNLEGQIVAVDPTNSEIVVRDIRPRDRRVKGDPGIISTLRVGDTVRVEWRDERSGEAHRIIEI